MIFYYFKDALMKTLQEKFWSGSFGNNYLKRNKFSNKRYDFFKNIFERNNLKIKNLYEIGANNGANLDAIKKINKEIETFGIEINKKAYNISKKKHNITHGSVFDNLNYDKKFDFVCTNGVLIHINPNYLNKVYDFFNKISKKYIFINEYHDPSPVKINYRGNKNVMFKRDFAYEIQKKLNLQLVDYGFSWKFDNQTYFDDMNWFLFKK